MKRLIGVGVGPGDPELVTVKAVRVLREADVVLVPVLATREPGGGPRGAVPGSQQGRAETIIRAYVAADRIRRLEFALNDTGGVTPRRAAAWHAAATAVAAAFAAGATAVAFGTLGDPGLYSTFSYLAQTVRTLVPEVTVETVAGITAMQDLASRAGLRAGRGHRTRHPRPPQRRPRRPGPGAGPGRDRGRLQDRRRRQPRTRPTPRPPPGGPPLDGAVIGARLGLDGELIAPAEHVLTADEPLPYLATLIVPATRPAATGAALPPPLAPQPPVPPCAPPAPRRNPIRRDHTSM